MNKKNRAAKADAPDAAPDLFLFIYYFCLDGAPNADAAGEVEGDAAGGGAAADVGVQQVA